MAQGLFMEALMDFSVAIMLEKKTQEYNEKIKRTEPQNANKLNTSYCFYEYYCSAGQAHYELAQYEEAQMHF